RPCASSSSAPPLAASSAAAKCRSCCTTDEARISHRGHRDHRGRRTDVLNPCLSALRLPLCPLWLITPLQPMFHHALLFALGLALFAVGGGLFALGAARVARRCGVNPFAVGLIAAGLGTASAALAFDLAATSRERMRLALGNMVGVNIANIGL